MKIIRYTLLLALLLLALLVTVACGSDNPPADTTGTSERVTDTPETTPETIPVTDPIEDTTPETPAETTPAVEIPPEEEAAHMIINGQSDYTIIVGADCAPAELTAARELQKYLGLMSGATLPIATDSDSAPSDKEIIIGVTTRAEPETFAMEDAFHVYFRERALYIEGGSPRGTLYGVYHFLESLGCRFYTIDTETVPTLPSITPLLTTNIADQPAFVYRDLFWSNTYDETLSAKLGLNGALMSGPYGRQLSEEVGGGISYAGPHFVHTFSYIMTEESHFATHPEYFSEINGVRTAKHLYSQLCMTNPEVLQIVITHVKGWLRANPEAKLVSVSQNDSFVYDSFCTCKDCQAIIDEEGSPAGPLLRFVNAVAEAIEEEFPDVYVDTLAYQYSLTPPKITKARDNVVVRFCTGACTAHPIAECDRNAGCMQNVLNWKEVCPRLYIWDYTTDFAHYLCPYPNLNSLQGNAQFFYENDVIGVFEQGIYNEPGNNGEFGELRSYLLAKLLWDPYADMDVLMDEFMTAYYGDAAPYIKEYLDYLHLIYKDNHLPMNISPESYYAYFRRDTVAHFNEVWDKAQEAVKDDPLLLEHVERSELQYRYIKKANGRGEFSPEDRKEQRRQERQFDEDCERLNVTRLNEGANVPWVDS